MKINPIRLARLFTFSWCFCILIFTQVVTYQIVASISQSIVFDTCVGITIGFIIAYIPLVFVGIAPSVILESLVTNPVIKSRLIISNNSWHGDNEYMIGLPGNTLCSHCWATPFRMSMSFYGGISLGSIFILIVILAYFIKLIALSFFLLFAKIFGYKIKSLKSIFFEVLVILNAPMQDALANISYRPIVMNKKEPGIFIKFIQKSVDVILALKNKACPTINWK